MDARRGVSSEPQRQTEDRSRAVQLGTKTLPPSSKSSEKPTSAPFFTGSVSVRSGTPTPEFSTEVDSGFKDSLSLRSSTPPPEFSIEPESAFKDSLSLRSSTPPPEFAIEPESAFKDSLSLRSRTPPPEFSIEVKSDAVSLRSRTPPPEFSFGLESFKQRRRSSDSNSENLHLLDSTTAQISVEYKKCLSSTCDRVTEGLEGAGDEKSLLKIYTEIYITHTPSKDEGKQHELTRLEAEFGTGTGQQETAIPVQDIFRPLPSDQGPIRLVLTSGVAGVGKTFSVLKFCLDWAQGSENQDVDLVVPLSFRELNLARERGYSLLELVHGFHASLRPLSAHTLLHSKTLFIFDGLDECQLHLDFTSEKISEVTLPSKIGLLLVNLIRGDLLPDALIWITSRPAAAKQVPLHCVHRLTKVRGFTDSQKEDYFTKRFPDELKRDTVLSHVSASHSLHSMCQIPIFCWITSTVLDHMLSRARSGPLPQTLTDMYAHFLIVQTYRKRKYRAESATLQVTERDCEVLLKLGRLAFDHLHSGNLLFYEEHLQKVGLDLKETSVYSGLCTEILKQEKIIFKKSVYCFVHLSVQEFLAAVYMLHCFNLRKAQEIQSFLCDWEENMPLDLFLLKCMEKSIENESGRLDLFVRFLHGLLLESNQRLLTVLLGSRQTDPQMIQKITQNLKQKNTGGISAPGSITVFYCLSEMHDQTVHQQILDLLKTEFKSGLAQFLCATLAQKLQMPQEVLDELNIKRFRRLADGRLQLVPPDTCREATILWNGLSREHSAVIASALKSASSELRFLDLWLRDWKAVEAFCEGLKHPHCRLETLSLHHSRLSERSCLCLTLALKSNPSHLRKLDLSWNEELEPGLKHICDYLQSPQCQLHLLRLENCRLGEGSCLALSSALALNPFHLRELDVTENQLTDAGVRHFCDVLKNPQLQLEHLRLDNCGLSEISCSDLASALISNPESNLKKLDLSVNRVQDCGVERLCTYLKMEQCCLQAMELKACDLTDQSCLALASSLNIHMKDLRLNWNPDMKDQGVAHMSSFIQTQSCALEDLRFRGCGVTGVGCSSLASALESTPLSPLRDLDLCENELTQSDVEKLMELLDDPQYQLEKLEWEEN